MPDTVADDEHGQTQCAGSALPWHESVLDLCRPNLFTQDRELSVRCDYGVGHTCLLIVGSVPAYTSNQHLQYCHKNLHLCSPVKLPAGSCRCHSQWALLAHCGCKNALPSRTTRIIVVLRDGVIHRVASLWAYCRQGPGPAARFVTQPGRRELASAGPVGRFEIVPHGITRQAASPWLACCTASGSQNGHHFQSPQQHSTAVHSTTMCWLLIWPVSASCGHTGCTPDCAI
jgi:hypothetical protein